MTEDIIELEELRIKVKELEEGGRGRSRSRKDNRNYSPTLLLAKRRCNRDKSVVSRSPPRSKSRTRPLSRERRGETADSTISNVGSVYLNDKLP